MDFDAFASSNCTVLTREWCSHFMMTTNQTMEQRFIEEAIIDYYILPHTHNTDT